MTVSSPWGLCDYHDLSAVVSTEIAELQKATRDITAMKMDAQRASTSDWVLAEARKHIREEIDAVVAIKGIELLKEFDTSIRRINDDILARNRDFTGLLELLEKYQTGIRSVNEEVLARKKDSSQPLAAMTASV